MADTPAPASTTTTAAMAPGAAAAGASPAPYRVLARKYRPAHFGELIGQAPMVRTLRNAFAHDRIPQAWMLTGVRGVGKTTTARILARALNYERDGEPRRPTVDLETHGIHCPAIMEGRHVDVIEMDAASHNGIADIREITDASRYKPVSAAYKIYILDEVHMLSREAFNGLLKTLEEPPAHVKFIFATTEIRKVPITVLSRCQRFDLRRIEADELVEHLGTVAAKEGIVAEPEALRLISRAAEGSVRDALSLLDQAIAHGGGSVTADGLREMLGLADRARVVDLFGLVMRGDAAGALAELSAQYEVGADPVVVLSDLAAFTHQVTRLKVTGAAPDAGEPQAVREKSAEFAGALGMAALSRMWQALLTGIAEVQAAGKPVMAAEMVLIRLCYMASLPDPDLLPLTQAPGSPGASEGLRRPSPSQGSRNGDGSRAAASPVAATAWSSASGAASTSALPFAPARPSAPGAAFVPAAHLASSRPAAAAPSSAGVPSSAAAPLAPSATAAAAPPTALLRELPETFEAAAALVGATNVRLKHAIERDMRLKSFARGRIEVTLAEGASPSVVGALGVRLTELTGERWIVTVSEGATAPTLRESYVAGQDALKVAAMTEPLVKALLDRFADAEITAVREPARQGDAAAAPGAPDDGAMRARDKG